MDLWSWKELTDETFTTKSVIHKLATSASSGNLLKYKLVGPAPGQRGGEGLTVTIHGVDRKRDSPPKCPDYLVTIRKM